MLAALAWNSAMPEDQSGTQQPEIPDRIFFKIGEVCDLAGVEAHVLRFWETEFPTLKPSKTPSGQRQYRRKDVETVLAIKSLLYDEGYTIPGARKALRARRKSKEDPGPVEAPPTPVETAGPSAPVPKPALREIRTKLEQILELLAP